MSSLALLSHRHSRAIPPAKGCARKEASPPTRVGFICLSRHLSIFFYSKLIKYTNRTEFKSHQGVCIENVPPGLSPSVLVCMCPRPSFTSRCVLAVTTDWVRRPSCPFIATLYWPWFLAGPLLPVVQCWRHLLVALFCPC